MKISGIFLTLLLSSSLLWAGIPPHSDDSTWLLGKWKFIGFIYQNVLHPPITPNLLLTFQFEEDGTSTLYWERTGEPGFCERKGKYSLEHNQLIDEVTWLNPKNAPDCGQDPDMRIGKKSINAYSQQDGHFHLEIGLAGEPLTYVFERLPENPNQ